MTENHVFFIINKYSGTGFQHSLEGRIIDACSECKLEATIEYTQEKGHATDLARQAVAEGFPKVFAMGGDGTLNEVARGLVNTPTEMGILPKGSGNGLARHLQIPMKTTDALKLLREYRVIDIDTIQVNGHLSVNVSGIGFDAHVAGKFGKNGKRGLLNYARLVLREFLSFKEFKTVMTLDGKTLTRETFIVALANSCQFGNNAKIAPFASVCDNLIDVCLIKKVPLWQVFGFVQKMFSGQMHRSAFVEILQGKKITIQYDVAMPFHIDGEAMGSEANFDISVAPRSLRVIVPAGTKTGF